MIIRSEFKVKSEYPNYQIEAENEHENYLVKMFRYALNDSSGALEYILREYFGMNYFPLFTHNVIFVYYQTKTEDAPTDPLKLTSTLKFSAQEEPTQDQQELIRILPATYIETPEPKAATEIATCSNPECGKEFKKLYLRHNFCCKKCGTRAKNIRYNENLKAKKATSELPVPEVPAADQAPVPDMIVPSRNVDVAAQKAKLAQIAKDIPIRRERPVLTKDL